MNLPFIYFCPRRETVSFSYAFESAPLEREVVGTGPNGDAGWIYGDQSITNMHNVGYHPETQEWRQIPGTDCFVGWSPEQMPCESVLRRGKVIAGEAIELGNGEKWEIPIARSWNEKGQFTNELPRRIDLNSDGKFVATEVLPKYESLWRTAESIADGLIFGDEDDSGNRKISIEYEDIFSVLKTNYRIDSVEIGILGLVTTDVDKLTEICNAVIDLKSLVAIKKKLELVT